MHRLIDFAKGLTSLVLVVALLVGIPVLLLVLVGFPLPTEAPDLATIRNHIEDGNIPDAFLVKSLAVVVWLVWAQLAVAVLIEGVALARGRISGRAPLMPGVQTAVGKLVASTVLLVSAFSTPRSAPTIPIETPTPTVVAPAEPAVIGNGVRSDPSSSSIDWPTDQREIRAVAMGEVGLDRAAGSVATIGVADRTYTTRSGDNWWDLAERLVGDGMRWSELRGLNSGREMPTGDVVTDRTEDVRSGWPLAVPADADPSLLDQSGADGLRSPMELLRPATLVYEGPTGGEPVAPGFAYQVVEGDNLWDIAQRHLGDPFRWPEIFEQSTDLTQTFGRRITDPNLIWPDSILVLPDDAVAVPPADPVLVSEVLGHPIDADIDADAGPDPVDDGPGDPDHDRAASDPGDPDGDPGVVDPADLDDIAGRAAGRIAELIGRGDDAGPGSETAVERGAGTSGPDDAEPPHPPTFPTASGVEATGPHGPDGPGTPDGGGGGSPSTSDRVTLPAVAVGSGSLLVATGLLGLLRRARRLRLAETGEASVPQPPPLELIDIETVLRDRSDERSARRLLSAVASLGVGVGRPDEPAPTPEVVRVVRNRVEVIVCGLADALPPPWRPVEVTAGEAGPGPDDDQLDHLANGTTLPAGRTAAVADLADLADRAGAVPVLPAPTVVSIGGGLLVNLEAVGVFGLQGPAELVAPAVRAMVHELVTVIDGITGAQAPEVWVADHLQGFDEHPSIRSAPVDRLAGRLDRWRDEAELALAASGAADPWALRAAGAIDVLPRPIVVVADGSERVDGPGLGPVVDLARHRRLPLAVVLVGDPDDRSVEPLLTAVVDHGTVHLSPLGLAASFQPLDLDLLLGVEALIDHARRTPIVPRPEPNWAPVDLEPDRLTLAPVGHDRDGPEADRPSQAPTEETPEHEIVTELPLEEEEVTDRSEASDAGLLVRVLGPVEIEGELAAGLSDDQRSVLTFLALVGPSSPSQIREALWPLGDIDDQRFDAVIGGLSRQLGHLFPEAGDGRHRLRSTVTDLGSARRWIAQAAAMSGDRRRNLLQLALSEVRGRPFAGVGERRWQWVEDHRLAIATQASSLLMDAAFDLCDQAYAAEDLHLALWACEVAALLDPLQETTVIRRVQLSVALGRRDEAAAVVDRWEDGFARSAGRPAPNGPRRALETAEELAPHAG